MEYLLFYMKIRYSSENMQIVISITPALFSYNIINKERINIIK